MVRLGKRFVVLFLLLVSVFQIQASQSIDSLETLLYQSHGVQRVGLLCDLCWEYRFVSADTALIYGKEAMELAKGLSYEKGVAQAYNDMGIIYVDRAEFDKAVDYFETAMLIRTKQNDSLGMASLYNKLGIVYQKQGKLKASLDNALNALDIYKELGHDLWVGYCLNNIAIINFNLGDLSTSLAYHHEALECRKRMNDSYGEAGSYSNIANVLLALHDTAQAIDNYEKALEITRRIENDESTAVTLTNLGAVYLSKGENEKALVFLEESLDLRTRMGDQKAIASTLLKIGRVKMNLKHFQEAFDALYKAKSMAISIGVIDEEMQAYYEIARYHAMQKSMDSAYVYMDYYSSTKDSVYAQRLNQQIIDAQTKYDTEKNAQEMALLQRENQLAAISIKQRKTEIWLLIVVIIFLSGTGVFFIYRRKQKQQSAMDAAIIKHNEEQLYAVLEAQEDERRRIARELHDGVGQTLSGVKLNWESAAAKLEKSATQIDFDRMTHLLDNAANEVRSISHQMMPKELEQFGLVSALQSVIDMTFVAGHLKSSFDHFNMDERLPKHIELGLFRVAQELFSNIIKHAAATQVNVQLLKHKEHLVFVIEDNGKGFDYDEHRGKGIGLMNIEGRVQALKGVVNYESAIGKGSMVSIRIPLL